jgi:hypothetical protein
MGRGAASFRAVPSAHAELSWLRAEASRIRSLRLSRKDVMKAIVEAAFRGSEPAIDKPRDLDRSKVIDEEMRLRRSLFAILLGREDS